MDHRTSRKQKYRIEALFGLDYCECCCQKQGALTQKITLNKPQKLRRFKSNIFALQDMQIIRQSFEDFHTSRITEEALGSTFTLTIESQKPTKIEPSQYSWKHINKTEMQSSEQTFHKILLLTQQQRKAEKYQLRGSDENSYQTEKCR